MSGFEAEGGSIFTHAIPISHMGATKATSKGHFIQYLTSLQPKYEHKFVFQHAMLLIKNHTVTSMALSSVTVLTKYIHR